MMADVGRTGYPIQLARNDSLKPQLQYGAIDILGTPEALFYPPDNGRPLRLNREQIQEQIKKYENDPITRRQLEKGLKDLDNVNEQRKRW
jgi:hypothetical protein